MFKTQQLSDAWGRTRWWVRLLFLALAGGLAGFGQAPFDVPVLSLIAIALAILALRHTPQQSAFNIGWAFGFGYFAMTLYWLVEPFLVEPEKTAWMAPFALAAMSGGLALFWGLAFRVAGRGNGLLLCLTWGLAEYLRAYVLTGFPWVLVGYIWVNTPVYHGAAILGPHGITVLTFLASLVIARGGVVLRVLVCGLAAFAPFAPTWDDTRDRTGRPVVRLIHPDVLQQDKWHPDRRDAIFQSQLDLTAAAPAVDLVVWPETSVYLPMSAAKDYLVEAAQGTNLIVGLQSKSAPLTYHNSLALLSGDGRVAASYDKFRLVPFGEFFPMGDFLGRLGVRGLAARDGAGFVPGPGPQTIHIDGIGHIQPLICYEGIFPQDVARTPQRPDAIVLITNDAWFGRFQGPSQHFAQARARAIEAGVPVVRVANRGISTIIDPRGGWTSALGLADKGALDAVLPKALPETPYARFRDVPFGILCVLLLGAAFSRRRPAKTVDLQTPPF